MALQSRFKFSIRSLLIAVAVASLLLLLIRSYTNHNVAIKSEMYIIGYPGVDLKSLRGDLDKIVSKHGFRVTRRPSSLGVPESASRYSWYVKNADFSTVVYIVAVEWKDQIMVYGVCVYSDRLVDMEEARQQLKDAEDVIRKWWSNNQQPDCK